MPDQFRLSSSPSQQPHRLSRKPTADNRRFIGVMIGTGAAAAVLAALSAGALVSSASAPDAAINAGPGGRTVLAAASQPETFAIVPVSVIETRPVFFFGTGDNSAGFYAERPSE